MPGLNSGLQDFWPGKFTYSAFEASCKLAFAWVLGSNSGRFTYSAVLLPSKLVFKWVLGIQLRPSCFHSKDFTPPPLVLSSLGNFSFDAIH